MALSRQRKILIGVLAVGLGGLTVDRLVLSAPVTGADEAAAELLIEPMAAASATALPPKPAASEPGMAALAQRLESLSPKGQAQDEPMRDAFEPPAQWVAQGLAEPTTVVAELRSFTQRHQLQAVMSDSRGGMAMVDGRPLLVGQKLDGAELVEVRRRSAVFASGDSRFELALSVKE